MIAMPTDKQYKTIKERNLAYQTALLTFKADITVNYNTAFLITKALYETIDIVELKSDEGTQLFCWSEVDQLYVELQEMIKDFVADAIITLQLKRPFTALLNDVMQFLSANSYHFTPYKRKMHAPPRHIMAFKNGVYNLKTGEMLNESEVMHYHFTQRRPLNFMTAPANIVYKEIITRIFKDWSQGRKDVEFLLLQYLRAIIEGDNRGRGLILYGEGGNGKSSFINIAERLVGMSAVLRVNIHQMENSFNLQGFTRKTSLISGDELRSSYRFGGESLSTCKMILDNQSFVLNLKGQTPMRVFPNTCLIQSTNTPLRFDESNDAIRDRFLYIEWSPQNYRDLSRSNESAFDLKKLIQDDQFIENVLGYVYENTTYFTHFTIPESVQQTTSKQVKESDTLERFLDYLDGEEFLQHNSLITVSVLYYLYQQWLKEDNPSTKPMGKNIFTSRLNPKLVKRGWIYQSKNERPVYHRPANTPFNQLNFLHVQALTGYDASLRLKNESIYRRSPFYLNPEQHLNLNDTISFIKECEDKGVIDVEELTAHQKRILVYHCFDLNNLKLRGLIEDWSDLY